MRCAGRTKAAAREYYHLYREVCERKWRGLELVNHGAGRCEGTAELGHVALELDGEVVRSNGRPAARRGLRRETMLHRLIRAGAALALAGALSGAPRPAQPFEAVSYDGRTVSLDALKGKAAVLMFFSTDCPHCQRTALRIDPDLPFAPGAGIRGRRALAEQDGQCRPQGIREPVPGELSP